jgi:hypothetical protein
MKRSSTRPRRGNTESVNRSTAVSATILAYGQFYSPTEAQVLAEDCRIEHNIHRPHGSLDFLTSEAFQQQWTPTEFNQPQITSPVDPLLGPVRN